MNETTYITSTNELHEIIQRCPKCKHATLNGTFIIPFHHLTAILLKKYHNQKNFCLILNSEIGSHKVGHWFSIIIYQKKYAILCDGLNEIKFNTQIMQYIKHFCSINNLKLIDLSCKYQQIQSKKCGYLALGMVLFSHKFTFKNFLKFKKIFKKNSTETNENYIFKLTKKHFNLKF